MENKILHKSELNKKELKAIKALESLSKIWPKSLWLWSASGDLFVMKNEWCENKDGRKKNGCVDSDGIVTQITNITNDGGDW